MAQLSNHGNFMWWEVMNSNKYELSVVTISVVILATLWYKLTLGNGTTLPPGPLSLPIVGYLPFLGPELPKQFTTMANKYGPIFKFYLGKKLFIVINTPELVKAVVRDQDEIFANRDLTVAASVITYRGKDIIFSNNNSNLRNLRKIFSHELLGNENLKACSSFRRDEVRKTINNVFGKIGSKVNISELSYWTEVNILTRMVWGNTSNEGAKDSDFGADMQMVAAKIVEIFGRPNLSDFFPILAWFDLQGVEADMKKQLKKFDQIFESIIEDRRIYNSKRPQDQRVGHEGKKDFLQFLLDLMDQKDATKSLNITQVKLLLADVVTGGTETITKLIEWAMTNIMNNHSVMKKVQDELAQVVGVNNLVEESHLPKLQYLDATIKETFRLYPVAPLLIPRSPSKTCTVGGYTIPKGSSIFLNVWSIHRDSRYWDNPLEFNPERFLGTDRWDYTGNNLKFFPFGSGRRLCPGIPLAEKMQMYILASLLHSFDWSLPKDEKHDMSAKFGPSLKKAKPLIAIPSQRLPDVSLYM